MCRPIRTVDHRDLNGTARSAGAGDRQHRECPTTLGKEATLNSRRLQFIGVGLTAATCAFGVLHAERLAAEVKYFGKKSANPTTVANPNARDAQLLSEIPPDNVSPPNAASARASDKPIKLNYLGKSWDDVLRDVAQQSGRSLVMDKTPPGRFSRNDWTRYSLHDALRILNRELEPKGFRVLERGQFLDLIFLRDARQDYSRPVLDVAHTSREQADAEASRNDEPQPPRTQRRRQATAELPESSRSRSSFRDEAATSPRPFPQAKRARSDSAIQLAAHTNPLEDDEDDEDDDEKQLAGPVGHRPHGADVPRDSQPRWVEVALKHQSARQVSRSLYQAFLSSAELVEQGPRGLPGFVVLNESSKNAGRASVAAGRLEKPSKEQRVRFRIGIDTKGERLVLDGSPAEVAGVRRLIAKLDIEFNNKDHSVRLVASNRDVRDVAQALRPAVKQLAQSGREAASNELELEADEMPAKGLAKKGTAKSKAVPKPGVSRPDPLREQEGETTKPGGKPDVPAIIGGLKGDVNVEALDDLGVLILRGNEQDVEAVMNIIRQIEKLSVGTTPDIHLRLLEHVDSESLAELLTSVYERLNRSRGRSAQDMTQQVTIMAVGKPNAVLILASQNGIDAVNELIDKLDQPIDPSSEFEVFRLRYAIASQVLTAIDIFFSGGTTTGGGVGVRVGRVAVGVCVGG